MKQRTLTAKDRKKTQPAKQKRVVGGVRDRGGESQRASNEVVSVLADLLRMPISLPMTKADWRNALGLLVHLERCHRAALDVPGIRLALFRTENVGIHCADPAYRLVSDLLYRARRRCDVEINGGGMRMDTEDKGERE